MVAEGLSASGDPEGFLPPLRGGIRKRIYLGMGATFLGQVLELASRLLLVPLYLGAWGVETYGKWQVLLALAAYLSLTDFGGQFYILNSMTQAYAQNDLTKFRRILHSGLAVYLILPGMVILSLAVGLALALGVGLLGAGNGEGGMAAVVILLLGSQIILAMPQRILFGVYWAVGMLPRAAMLSNLLGMCRFAFVAGGLLAGYGMVGIAVLGNLPFLLMLVGVVFLIRRAYPQFGLPGLKDANRGDMRAMLRPGFHFFLLQLTQAISLQGPIIIVGAMLGAVQVVVFSTLRTMASPMRQFLGLVMNSAWPELTRLDARRDAERSRGLLGVIMRAALVFSAVFAILLQVYGEALYALWLRGAVEFDRGILNLLIVYGIQFVFWAAAANYLMAINEHERVSKAAFASSIAGIMLAAAGGKAFGLPGAVGGLAAGELLLIFWAAPLLVHRARRDLRVSMFVKEILPPAAAVGVSGVSGMLAFLAVPLLLFWLAIGLWPRFGVRRQARESMP